MGKPQCPECNGNEILLSVNDELVAHMVCDTCGNKSESFRVYPEDEKSKDRDDPDRLLDPENDGGEARPHEQPERKDHE